MPGGRVRFEVVLFDLLSALLDSWSLWDRIAGGLESGRRWRLRYLELSYAAGAYRDYGRLVAQAGLEAGLGEGPAAELIERWDELQPWPEATAVLRALRSRYRLGVLTNCSESLAARAVERTGVTFDVIVSAESCGWYKPAPAAYRAGLAALGSTPERTPFVAGSPFDVAGASAAGMPVFLHDRLGLAGAPVRRLARKVADTLEPLPAWLGTA